MWKRIFMLLFSLITALSITGVSGADLPESQELTLNPETLGFGLYLDIDYENRLLCNLRPWQTGEMILAGIRESNVRLADSEGREVSRNSTPHTGYRLQKLEGDSVVYELSLVLLGDVNGDGDLSTSDYMIVRKCFAGQYELEGAYFKAADVSRNERMDTADYLRIKSHFAGTYDVFDAGSTTIAFGSDIHIGAAEERKDNFRSAFDTFYKMDPYLDAVAFAGDLVDNGYDNEYKVYSNIVKEKIKPDTAYTAVMGNHEWYRDGWGLDVIANGFTKKYQRYFTNGTGQAIASDRVVNGIHIIAVSPDNEMDYYHSREAFIRKAVKAAAAEDPNKPIFLVAHKPAAYTVVSSWDDASGTTAGCAPDWTPEFSAFLAQYPQIIYISGHSHDTIKNPLSIHQKDFTSINDGSIASGEGLFVHVSEDNLVTVFRLNTADGAYLADPWVIDIPKVVESKDNFTYGDKRYEASATLEFKNPAFVLESRGRDRVTISLPEATGEDEVGCGYPQYYIAQILDKKENTYVPKPDSTETKYYFYVDDGKIDLRKEFKGLTPGTDYVLQLYAINPLFKPSETITFDFSTRA